MRRRCGESQPSLHWKGLLFIARASRIYGPRAAQRARGIARSESLHGLSYSSAEGPRQAGPASWAAAVAATVRCVAGYGRRDCCDFFVPGPFRKYFVIFWSKWSTVRNQFRRHGFGRRLPFFQEEARKYFLQNLLIN